VPGPITEAMEYDEHGKSGQARDKVTGQLVWQCRVMDNDSTLGSRSRETVVKILSDRMHTSCPVSARQDRTRASASRWPLTASRSKNVWHSSITVTTSGKVGPGKSRYGEDQVTKCQPVPSAFWRPWRPIA
jgi:hypothetical protein